MERTTLLHHHHHQQHQLEINNSSVITSSASCTNPNNNNEGPKAVLRSDNNPYPTTFVQADTSNFKQVVQMLTGSTTTTDQQQPRPDPSPSLRAVAISPIRTASKKQQGFKLYERRNSLKNSLMINTLHAEFSSPRDAAAATPPGPGFSPRNLFPHHHHNEALSPSVLDFPKLTLSSPITPLNNDPFRQVLLAEKGFYFHPSHMNTPRDSEPQLLPLFPVSSPRISAPPILKKSHRLLSGNQNGVFSRLIQGLPFSSTLWVKDFLQEVMVESDFLLLNIFHPSGN